jgi:hypothetical protein
MRAGDAAHKRGFSGPVCADQREDLALIHRQTNTAYGGQQAVTAFQAVDGEEGQRKEGRTSFLKKRSKKLLLIWATGVATSTVQVNKSFLLLFFKKEVLAFLNMRDGTRP